MKVYLLKVLGIPGLETHTERRLVASTESFTLHEDCLRLGALEAFEFGEAVINGTYLIEVQNEDSSTLKRYIHLKGLEVTARNGLYEIMIYFDDVRI